MPPQTAFWRLVLLALAAAVTALSVASFPPSAIPGNALTRFIANLLFGDVSNADKVGHFIAYVGLGGAAFFAQIARRPIWLAPLLLALYGAALEGVQFFLAHRTADIVDAAVNGAGAAIGFAAAALMRRLLFGKER